VSEATDELMRILQVMASRANGGAETYSTDMMESLHRRGVEQVLVVSKGSMHHDPLVAAGARVESWPLAFPQLLLARRRMRRLIDEFRPDIVHCWMRRAASLMPRLDQPTIGWFGGYYAPTDFPLCTHFIGVTPGIVAHMAANGVAPDRAFFVPTFPTIESEGRVERSSFDTPDDAVVLLALSRLHVKKGLDVLLKALVELPRCFAWLAGDGPLEGQLQRHARRLGVADRVRFLGWRSDRGALLRAADICVLPSRYEPFGTVMLEAWAAERPLIAAASQGPAAVINDGDNGLLVPIDDVEALVGAVRRVGEEPGLAAKIIAGGKRDFEQGYTREAVTRRMLDVYEKLISERAAGECIRARG